MPSTEKGVAGRPATGVAAWLRREAGLELRWITAVLVSWEVWALALVTLVLLTAAYQVRRPYFVDVGGGYDDAYVLNFHGKEGDASNSFRWTDKYSYIRLPGLGGGLPYRLEVQLAAVRPDEAPSPRAEIIVNGQHLDTLALTANWSTYSFDLSGPIAESRDVVLEIRSDTYRPEGERGLDLGTQVDWVSYSPAGTGFVVPPASQLTYALFIVAGAYAMARRAFLGLAGRSGVPRAVSALAGILLLSGICYMVALQRLDYTPYAGNLLLVLLLGGFIFLAGERVIRAIFRLAGLESGDRERRILLVIALMAFLAKFGGLAYPHMIMIDLPWHMRFLRMAMAGQFAELYFPSPLSSVPDEWNMEILIPKSPLFYFVAAPVSLLPIPLETSVKLFVTLLDVSVLLVIFFLVRSFYGSSRAALFAAAVYAFTPLSYRMLSYGILPTIFAQWLTVLTFALILAKLQRLGRWPALAAISVLLAATMVAFPTIMVFNSIVLTLWGLLLLVLGDQQAERRSVKYLALSVAGGLAIAFLAYYVQYLQPLLTITLPAYAERLSTGTRQVAGTGGLLETARWSLSFYGTALPFIGSIFGLWSYGLRRRDRLWYLLLAWLVIPVVFGLVGMRVDMIGKHLLYAMVPLSIGLGVLLDRFSSRGRLGSLTTYLILATLIWSGLSFWIFRILYAGH